MPKTRFPAAQKAIEAMTPRELLLEAMMLATSRTEVLQALAIELLHRSGIDGTQPTDGHRFEAVTRETAFPALQKAMEEMTASKRAAAAQVLADGSNPLLQALSAELRNANAVDAAEQAARDIQRLEHHRARIAAIEATLPAPGSPAEHEQATQLRDQAWAHHDRESRIDDIPPAA
ncbi:hypothetical protein QMK19_30565 [Streptomyces sp. H10-C2]|uniref:hypothetical protein n=1 Tax=unclassified Streptomyces TaxID=2593676 RepID=UPI0024B8F891|nr:MULTISPECIES: hypothetical protein [unclassified Streptomyces]MDJ0345956.1 hypothetical protein [Streptomyces sp. PH10-H1]MDJ0373877.1 hypothetical protein [Streptomyces sp. H10-C2]